VGDEGGWQLAQVNVALPRAPLDAPLMSGFVHALGRLEALRAGGPSPAGFSLGLQVGPDGRRAGPR
jgi:hypothetical protein